MDTNASKGFFDVFGDFLKNTFGGTNQLIENGPIGLGAVIFVLVFLVLAIALLRGAAINQNSTRLLNRFMALGTLCVALSLATTFASSFMGKERKLTLTFSPDFVVNQLPPPSFIPNKGAGDVRTGYVVTLNKDDQLQVNFDQTIAAVKVLRQVASAAQNELSGIKQVAASQAAQLETLTQSFRTTVAAARPKLNNDEVRALNDVEGRLSSMKRVMQLR